MPTTLDLIVRGATVIDGTRAPRFEADVGIAAGRIVAVGDLGTQAAKQVLDAHGCVVAPGFIDVHTHDDAALLHEPLLPFKVSQGVTTVITGNCGVSLAPLPASGTLPAPLDLMEPPEQAQPLRFTDFGDFLRALDHAPAAVNVAALVGHSSLRVCVMDNTNRAASATERQAMRGLLEQALAAGAIGLSTGTFYPPAAQASREEIIDIGQPLTARKAIYATHMRDESDAVMAALDETFEIGRALDVPVVISHHKVTQQQNFGRSKETLAHIARTMEHQCVALDCYPYTAGSTMIRTDRAMMGGRMVIASSVPHPECVGREISDIAAEWGVERDEAALRLQPGSAIYFLMDEADVQRILSFEHTMIGSDGIAIGGKPHPRLWGTFPRVLGHYSRDLGLFPLETAVWKMTGLPARNFGLTERGRISVGCHADLVVFDPNTVRDTASYDNPTQAAAGIQTVLVNGQTIWQDGHSTGARPGQVLRPQ